MVYIVASIPPPTPDVFGGGVGIAGLAGMEDAEAPPRGAEDTGGGAFGVKDTG
jgi:hypothetical protein